MSEERWGKFRRLYGTQRWRRLAKKQVALEPLCAMCAKLDRATEAEVCDHVNGHPDDETEEQFWSGPFQSLCKGCHDGAKKREENGRPLVGCDADGWPIEL